MAMSVPMTPVIQQAAASIPTTQQPVMMAMPAPRQILAMPDSVWVGLLQTVTMAMSVRMIHVILWVVA